LVINSLLEKEGLSGQVQMIYIDPPYGIRYGSNFQPFVKKPKSQTEKDEDLTAEPEQIRAFRDTWELGIHSYLAYLRDRLLLARELLRESGSCFVQIGDENVHRVGMVLDDIFGAENRMATISFATTSGSSTSHLPQVADYLLWYAKDKDKAKYHQLYEPLTRAETIDYFSSWASVELPDGGSRKPTDEERFNPDKYLPKGARMYQRIGLDSQDASTTGRSKPYEWKGRIFHCGKNRHWSISINGLNRLAELGRLEALEGKDSLRWKKYEDEIPGRRINNIWERMYPREKRYVVETSTKAIQRCLLMTTDPGDLVFDPTCGSGATAYVAEQWGRRWITCDTSRVALTLAKSRVMTAVYDYYELAHAQEGVGSGFKYKTVSNVSPSILANDAPSPTITLYDQPLVDKTKTRVAGPFTVEAVPAPTVKPLEAIEDLAPLPADESISRTGETHRQGDWRDELLKTGIRGKAGQRISFARLEPLPGTRWLHANGETRPDAAGAEVFRDPGTAYNPERVVVSFGPDHAPLEQRQIALAIEDAQRLVPAPKIIVFAAFQFDPEASKDIDETNWPGVTLLKAQMNADLLTDDLKKKRASNTKTGDVESGGANQIAVWMLDPNYDGRSLFPRQVFFPMSGEDSEDDGWTKLARDLNSEIDLDLVESYRGTVSLPFEPGDHERAAVKIVDDRGIESLRIVELP
jgi:adenine-specific DNA-methyltransferase